MHRLAVWITTHKKTILFAFLILMVVSVFGFLQVGVNYDLASYLPQDTDSTKALKVMRDAFDSELPNLQVMLKVTDVADALAKKHALEAEPYITDVLWLDDQADVATPLELQDQNLAKSFYTDGYALYTVTVNDALKETEAAHLIRRHIGEEGFLAGQLIETASAQDAVKSEMTGILLIAVPIALVILLITSSSWIEPLLFLATISAGVLLNFGSNIILGDVSFITQSVAGVLQLAVTMDYTIYLLHRFEEYRPLSSSNEEAMQKAIVKSLPAIFASALTTFFGFLALIFMRFGIGSDLGIVLAKGVVLSFITVTLLLPVLVLLLIRVIDKTRHKSFWPSFKGLGRFSARIGTVAVIVALIVAYPAFRMSRQNAFQYGMGDFAKGSIEETDLAEIRARFSRQEQMVMLVPNHEFAVQAELVKSLNELPQITSIIDYTTLVGRGIPADFLPESDRNMLISENYSRLILIADVEPESEETFALAEKIRLITAEYFPEGSHLVGQSFSLVDMRDTIQRDDLIVNGLAILAVALVIMFTFRSFVLPILLVLTIEISIWINLAIPFVSGVSIAYIGYLVISTVQLGATVDYAILMSQNYLDSRQHMKKWEAAAVSTAKTARTVIPPALILAGAGFALYFVSTLSVVSELGLVLGRGALISLGMVIFFLPVALALSDRALGTLSFGKKRVLKGVHDEK